jgi:hypothetical protein
MRFLRAGLVTLLPGGPGIASAGIMTGPRGAPLDWDSVAAGNTCRRTSQETRPGLSHGLIGVASAAVERREASPLRVLRDAAEHSEGAAASADAASFGLRLPALRLPSFKGGTKNWRGCWNAKTRMRWRRGNASLRA